MKTFVKIKYILLLLSVILYFSSCEKPASEKEYGFALIYMPQAAVSGGLDINYPVPGSGDVRYPNYKYDSINGKLEIILGVYRSGMQALDEFSVDIYANNDKLNSIIGDGTIVDGDKLPADVCSFPPSATVTSGNRETIFYLSIDVAKLNSTYSSLYGKKMGFAIGIRNPTKYELNESLSTTLVLIDSKKFMKKPIVVK
jgi:hypothetical protein